MRFALDGYDEMIVKIVDEPLPVARLHSDGSFGEILQPIAVVFQSPQQVGFVVIGDGRLDFSS